MAGGFHTHVHLFDFLSPLSLLCGIHRTMENFPPSSNLRQILFCKKSFHICKRISHFDINSDKPILVVECSHPNSWYKILNRNDKVLGVESFGESAPGNQLLEHFGFTVENVVKMAKSLIND